MTNELTQNLKEFENRIKIAAHSGANAKEKMLDKLKNEAKDLHKKMSSAVSLYQSTHKKLEETLHNIENIDEYMQKRSKNKAKSKKEVAQ